MANKPLNNITKKQCLDMIKGYKREIINSERFYKECLEKEIKHYREGIDNCKRVLLSKYNYDIESNL